MTSPLTLLPRGTRVRYHGSVESEHGQIYVVDDGWPHDVWGAAYDLVRESVSNGVRTEHHMWGARQKSFTVLGAAEGRFE